MFVFVVSVLGLLGLGGCCDLYGWLSKLWSLFGSLL